MIEDFGYRFLGMSRMAEAIVLQEHGGPEALRLAIVAVGAPGPGEIRLRQTAVGVNFHDIYVRTGLYRTLALPGTPGVEAAGVIEAVGAGVHGLYVGDRVAYVSPAYGAYASHRLLRAELAIRPPEQLSDIEVAASLTRALTACVLVRKAYRIRRDDVVLVHAAAGGVGQLVCAWARHLGATVIGTVGSAAKAEIAKGAGAHLTILYREENFVNRVLEFTENTGVAAVYDSVGAETFLGSMQCLAYEGQLVNFGQSSGPVAPFAPSLLAAKSLSVSRPIVFHYLRDTARTAALTAETFAAFAQGIIAPLAPEALPLREAADAHRRLEQRRAGRGVVLIP